MLYLEPPFHIIDGVSIFRDHEDKEQYYYMPMEPQLTLRKQEESDVGIPQIQLIKYRGNAGSGGFLNFDVHLGLDGDKVEEIASTIQSKDGLDNKPRLAPVPLLDGSVKLMMLGKQTDVSEDGTVTTSGGDGEGPKFVTNMAHYAKPSLYGNNQAAFSVQLDESGVVAVEESIKGHMAPIGIVYSLEYMALRDGYKVKATADWNRVQKHLEESFTIDTPVFTSSIDTVVDELIEEQIIDLQIDKLFISGDDTSAMEGRMDMAVNAVKSMVLENFFEPSLDPAEREHEEDWVDDAVRVAMMFATHGASEAKLFSYKKIDVTRIDKKKLDISMSERSAVIRGIYPQGHLQGLFSVLQEPDVDLSQFIIPVELDSDWFKKRTINVIARTDFDSENVESINVRLAYGEDHKNVLLEKGKDKETVEWSSLIVDGKFVDEVKVSYQIHFKSVDGNEHPHTLKSEEFIRTTENVEIRPRDLFGQAPIAITALNFPWETYSHVEVTTAYVDEQNQIDQEESFLLDKENASAIWKLFILDPSHKKFSYKLHYRAVDHQDVETGWIETDEERITIRDPFPTKRKINFVAAIDWETMLNVFVDVVYEDLENDIRESKSISFSPDRKDPKEVVLQEFVDPQKRIISYKVTLLSNTGDITEIPDCQTLADRVFITPQMKGHKILTIDPSGIDFDKKKINKLEVSLRYEDTEAGLSFKESYDFASAEDRPRHFEYDFAGAPTAGPEMQMRIRHSNGMQRMTDWEVITEDPLKLEID
ncbi:hypothetical protein [Nonlabens xiamenensis]|uniref:hypothetical protein n=1 Tax=Nonlabens xiamenensis TaxID=2341043 RepID=UPI000F6109E7|nr:hypothetical protein [Nonlabens xiamenensis]